MNQITQLIQHNDKITDTEISHRNGLPRPKIYNRTEEHNCLVHARTGRHLTWTKRPIFTEATLALFA
jgi:hypothetical protein